MRSAISGQSRRFLQSQSATGHCASVIIFFLVKTIKNAFKCHRFETAETEASSLNSYITRILTSLNSKSALELRCLSPAWMECMDKRKPPGTKAHESLPRARAGPQPNTRAMCRAPDLPRSAQRHTGKQGAQASQCLVIHFGRSRFKSYSVP